MALTVFVGYQFWRLYYLSNRIGLFVLQWPLPLCDIAIIIMVKVIYVCTFESYDDSTVTYFIPFFLLLYAYLFFSLVLLLLLLAWCVAIQKTPSSQYMAVEQRPTLASRAENNLCFRILLYSNYVCLVFLLVGYFFSLYFYYANWPYPDTLFLLKTSLGLELADFVLNVIEDCITYLIYKRTPNSYLRSKSSLPGLGGCFALSGPESDEIVIQLPDLH